MTDREKNYALPIIMMFALFFMVSFVTGLQNPMGVIVKNQFGASNFMSQLGNAANFIAYAFMGIPAGMLLQKIGYKRTALLAIVIGCVGVGIQYLSGEMESFTIYLTGAFVSGFSMCMLNTVVNPMLNTLGGGGKKGNILLQLGGSINSIGATIVPVLVGYLIGNASKATIKEANPALFLAMGIFVLAFLVLLLVKIPEPFLVKKEKIQGKYSAFSFRHFCLGLVAIFVYVGIEVGIPNTTNLYMTSAVDKGGLGIDITIAGTVVGTYWFLMLLGRLAGAFLGSRVSSKIMLAFASLLGLIFILLAIISPISTTINIPVFKSDISLGFAELPITIVFFILCGLCTSVMWGGIFNLAVEGLGKYVSVASGIFMMMVCGGGILPLIQNYFVDVVGFLSSYWLVILEFAFILYYALLGSKNVNKDIPID